MPTFKDPFGVGIFRAHSRQALDEIVGKRDQAHSILAPHADGLPVELEIRPL